jgi:hypothetical protein
MKRQILVVFFASSYGGIWLASETEFLVSNCYVELSKKSASTPMRLEHVPQASGAQVEQCLILPVYPWFCIVT